MTVAAQDSDKLSILNTVFGYSSFHPMQEEVIERVCNGKDALVLMPTGGGKSLCFQIPALVLTGTALVISPLVALMRDQVEALKVMGIAAACLNGSQTAAETAHVLTELNNGNLKLLYVAPERLFSTASTELLSAAQWSMVAVDEAHCISMWGHDFRPEYTKLGMLRKNLPQVPFIALTASADRVIRHDIQNQLTIPDEGVFVSSFDRPNLRLEVRPGRKRLEQIIDFLIPRKGQAGIIYCLSRTGTEDLASRLQQKGFRAEAYHAGLDHHTRNRVQDAFLRDDVDIVCATIAFGMGIDKSNVRWVIHYNLPKNIEGYYQEIGRAGRDGLPADTLLFHSFADIRTHRDMLANSPDERREILSAKLDRMQAYAEATSCRRQVLLAYFNEASHETCDNCDICSNPPEGFDGTILVQKVLSAVARTEGQATARQVASILRGSRAADIRDRGWDTIKTWGVGNDVDWEDWMAYLSQIINSGWVDVAYDKGGILRLNPLSKEILKGERQVTLVKQGQVQPAALSGKTDKTASKTIQTADFDTNLFEHLRVLRKKLADEHEIPAFVIFSDKSLRDMAARKPTNMAEFGQVYGVGEHKREAYGEIFLQTLREYTAS